MQLSTCLAGDVVAPACSATKQLTAAPTSTARRQCHWPLYVVAVTALDADLRSQQCQLGNQPAAPSLRVLPKVHPAASAYQASGLR